MQTITVNEALPVRTQFLIFTLFGDYVDERGGQIWTSSLLELMAPLEVSERAARSTLSRIARKGWVESQMHGRRSRYTLTPRGKALLSGGRQRIFEPIFTKWDGQWHLMVYSLPEKKRRKRHALRKQLNWLGFGPLAPGTWLSPHNRRAELKYLLGDLKIEMYVDLFCGLYLGPANTEEMVNRCWDLEGLGSQYHEFISHYKPEYLQHLEAVDEGQTLSPMDCFKRRFWLTHDFQSFPLKDPNLPAELLPSDWIGFEARKLFDEYHYLLGTYANEYVDKVMKPDHFLSAG